MIFSKWKNNGELDYVACWYKKAADYIENTSIECAFVSTNSICQGQQVFPLWNAFVYSMVFILILHIRTFRWDSEASIKAHVHCVIVGFSVIAPNTKEKRIFDNGTVKKLKISMAYLLNAHNVFIAKRKAPYL